MARRNRFVGTDTVRLPLSDGDWIEVKKQLNAGENRRVFAGLVKSLQAGEKPELDPEQVGKTKLVEYIVAWSLTDANEKPVPFSPSALDAVDEATYEEIRKAIDAHEDAMEKKRAEEKNAQDGATGSSPISPSVAG